MSFSTRTFLPLFGKKLFLTGCTGLFGKWLMVSLAKITRDLTVLTRDPDKLRSAFPEFLPNDIKFVKGDVRNFTFPECSFDYCIHAATPVVSDDLNDDAAEMHSIIVDGTYHVLDFCLKANVPRLLYVSSGAVYGAMPLSTGLVTEEFKCNPVNIYGSGKLMAEKICLKSEISCAIARCFAFVGPHMPLNAHFAIGNFLGNCLRNEPIIIKGDGQSLRSFMYSTDLVDWLLTMLYASKKNEIYNVGSSVAISIHDLAYLVRKVVGKEKLPIIIQNDASVPSNSYIPNNEKATKQLGLNVKIDLENAILKTFQSYRD